MPPITLVLVDDHRLVREALAGRLGCEPDLQVLALAPDADAGLRAVLEHKPDVVLLDIDIPGLSSFEAARVMAERCPRTRILFLSALSHDVCIEQALAVPTTAGYHTKNTEPEQLVAAIRTIGAGGVSFSPEVRARLVVDAGGLRLAARQRTRLSSLSARELDVLRYIARGLSQKEIAATLSLSPKTISYHSMSLMTKLNLHDRVALTRFAIAEGLESA